MPNNVILGADVQYTYRVRCEDCGQTRSVVRGSADGGAIDYREARQSAQESRCPHCAEEDFTSCFRGGSHSDRN